MIRPDEDREVSEPVEQEPDLPNPTALPLEAEPADVLEQVRSVPAEDEEHRPE